MDKKAPAKAGASLFDHEHLLQHLEPVVHILVNLILGEAVALLELAFELIAAAFDDVEVIVGKFAPFFLGGALELFPIAFDAVPIHRHLLLCRDDELTTAAFDRSGNNRHDQPAALASRRRAVKMNSV